MGADFYKEYNAKRYSESYWQIDEDRDKRFSKYIKAMIIF
jgi:hypothetical protein